QLGYNTMEASERNALSCQLEIAKSENEGGGRTWEPARANDDRQQQREAPKGKE
ncbi:hypothetical protein CRG98_047755, partial [Punica granatum]